MFNFKHFVTASMHRSHAPRWGKPAWTDGERDAGKGRALIEHDCKLLSVLFFQWVLEIEIPLEHACVVIAEATHISMWHLLVSHCEPRGAVLLGSLARPATGAPVWPYSSAHDMPWSLGRMRYLMQETLEERSQLALRLPL